MHKIKKYLRRHYLKLKFKLSKNPIYINSTDRQLGLTTLLIKESLNKNIPILVHNECQLKTMVNDIYRFLELVDPHSKTYIKKYYLLNCQNNTSHRGKRYPEILVDNALTELDVSKFTSYHPETTCRGFIRKIYN